MKKVDSHHFSNKSNASAEAVLLAAVAAQEALRKNQYTLDEYLDREVRDAVLRRRLSNLLFTLFRHKRFIDQAIKVNCAKAPNNELYALLAAASAMAAYQDSLAPASVVNIAVAAAKKAHSAAVSKFVNAVLRKVLLQLDEIDSKTPALPENILKRWRKEFAAETVEHLNTLFQHEAPSTVRLRKNFAAPEALQMPDIALELPWKFYLPNNMTEVLTSDEFKQGAFYIQDPAPAKVCSLLAENHALLPAKVNFIDLCAAPGGKLIMNMELLQDLDHQVDAVALDRSVKRLELVKENLERCKLQAEVIAADAAAALQLADRSFELVTCDVPCSNSGVFRRRPDALWRWQVGALAEICGLQQKILNNAGRLTAPGGLLLYSTCSLEKEENQQQIEKFLADNADFKLIDMLLFMPDEYCDGTFAALLQKNEA